MKTAEELSREINQAFLEYFKSDEYVNSVYKKVQEINDFCELEGK